MMAPNVLEDCTPLYVRRLSLYYLTSAMIVTTDNRTMMITEVTYERKWQDGSPAIFIEKLF